MQPWLNLLAPISRVSALGLPCFSSGRLAPESGRVEPGAGAEPYDAAADAVAQARGGEAGAAVVENAHQVALGDAAGCRVVGMQRDRLTAFDLGRAGMWAVIELAVQFVGRLVRQHVQRIALGSLAAQPLDRFQPDSVRWAVVVTERGNALGIDLDLARWCPERMCSGDRRGTVRASRAAAVCRRPRRYQLPRIASNDGRPTPTLADRDARLLVDVREPFADPATVGLGHAWRPFAARSPGRSHSRRALRRSARVPSS